MEQESILRKRKANDLLLFTHAFKVWYLQSSILEGEKYPRKRKEHSLSTHALGSMAASVASVPPLSCRFLYVIAYLSTVEINDKMILISIACTSFQGSVCAIQDSHFQLQFHLVYYEEKADRKSVV